MIVLAALLAAGAAALAVLPPPHARERLSTLRVQPPRPARELGAGAACVVAGLALAGVLGWPTGLVSGIVVAAAGPRLLAGLEPAAVRRDRERLVADLPLVLDLLGACLVGGAALPVAAVAVAQAVPGPCSTRLRAVVGALTVGTPQGEAWLLLAGNGADDPLRPAARMLSRAVEGGTPLAAAVERMAVEARAVARAGGAEAARRIGVLIVAPLGLCFLPAFVLLGIVPVVVGLAGPLLASF